jgi:hypothetical protein
MIVEYLSAASSNPCVSCNIIRAAFLPSSSPSLGWLLFCELWLYVFYPLHTVGLCVLLCVCVLCSLYSTYGMYDRSQTDGRLDIILL